MSSEEVGQALQALHAKLDAKSAQAYWTALSRFLRFEIEKAEFDRLATAAVGPHVALHNSVIFAMLKGAQGGDSMTKPDASASHPFTAHHLPAPHVSSSAGGEALHGAAAASSVSNVDLGAEAGAAGEAAPGAAAPVLKLKISGGSATATTVVDPAEEAQVRVLARFTRTHLGLCLLTLAAHLFSCAPRLRVTTAQRPVRADHRGGQGQQFDRCPTRGRRASPTRRARGEQPAARGRLCWARHVPAEQQRGAEHRPGRERTKGQHHRGASARRDPLTAARPLDGPAQPESRQHHRSLWQIRRLAQAFFRSFGTAPIATPIHGPVELYRAGYHLARLCLTCCDVYISMHNTIMVRARKT